MRRQVAVLLLLATLGVAASLCVVIIDEREVAFRTILNESDMVLPGLGLQLNPGSGDRPAILDQPGNILSDTTKCLVRMWYGGLDDLLIIRY